MKLPRIFGDKPAGSKFWPNRQFELLTQQMEFIGQQFGYRKKLLPNGDIIVSIINKNGPVPIHITKLIPAPLVTLFETVVEFDSGLLVWGWVNSYPLTVYVGDSLISYYASTAYPTGFDVDHYPSTHYTNTTPGRFYADEEYLPVVHNANPSRYTGLMRLFMQGKVARGVTLNTLPVELNPNVHGLVCDTAGDVYLAEIGSAVSVKKLTFSGPEEYRVTTHPYSVDLEDRGAVIALSRYFSYLVDSEDEWMSTDALVDSTDGAPAAWGWKFDYKNSRVAIVKFRAISGYDGSDWVPAYGDPDHQESALYRIDIGWTFNGSLQRYEPNVTENTIISWKKSRRRNLVNNLWVPIGAGGYYSLESFETHPYSNESFNIHVGVTSPVYCWFRKDGSLELQEFTQKALLSYTVGIHPPGMGPDQYFCGDDGIYVAQSSTYTPPTDLLGFKSTNYTQDLSVRYETGSLNKVTWSRTDAGNKAQVSTAWTFYPEQANKCQSVGTPVYDRPRVYISSATITGENVTTTVSAQMQESMIIDARDAESVFIVKRGEHYNSYTSRSSYQQVSIPLPGQGMMYAMWWQDRIGGVWQDETGPYKMPMGYGGGAPIDQGGTLSFQLRVGYVTTQAESTASQDVSEVHGVLLSGDNVTTLSLSYNTLSLFFPDSLLGGTASANTWSVGSFFGAKVISIANTLQTTDNYFVPDPEFFTFIGGA